MTAKQRRRVPKWLLFVFGACLVVGFIGAIANPGRDDSAPAAAAPTRTTAPTALPTKTPAATPTARPAEPTVQPPPTETASPATAAPSATLVLASPVALKNSNLRAGPGINYPVIGSAPAGQPLAVVATNPAGDWYQLSSGAWIADELVGNPPTGLPIAADIPPAPAARSAPAIVAPTAQPLPYAGGSSCDCSSNLYNCPDFVAWDAQSCYMRCMELVGRDVHGLDGDNDGSACEWEY